MDVRTVLRYEWGSAVSCAPRFGVSAVKAIVQEKYGPPDVLALKDVEMPVIGDDEVLIRVAAAAVHVGDSIVVRGAPFLVRLDTGLLRPTHGIPGYDVAGCVEAVGQNVTRLHPGDEVFGQARGSCAEYASAKECDVVSKPADLSHEEAAALTVSGLAALHALRDVAKLEPGQRILVNGASGGVGTYAVQIAKSFRAEVTGVCSAANAELVRSLGADHVIDYAREDFTRGGSRYEVILDNVENRPLSDCRRALTPRGMLILNSGTGASGLGFLLRLVKPLLLNPFVRHRLRRFLSVPKTEDLLALRRLVEAGDVRPVVSERYRLDGVPEALRRIEAGHVRGKVVIIVGPTT